jgi:hypothetical protein
MIFRYILKIVIDLYRWTISPLFAPTCRFVPTCSQYALDAIEAHKPFKALFLILKRILKCHPWGSHGYDPVPLSKRDR